MDDEVSKVLCCKCKTAGKSQGWFLCLNVFHSTESELRHSQVKAKKKINALFVLACARGYLDDVSMYLPAVQAR